MHRRVLITGLGVVSSIGVGVNAFWQGLTAGSTGLTCASPELAAHGAKVVGAIRNFCGAGYLNNERHARVLNRTFELLLGAGALAAADGSLAATRIRPERLGVVVGIGPIDQYTEDLILAGRHAQTATQVDLRRFVEQASTLYPLRRLRLLPNIGAAVLSIEHQAMGPSLTLVSGHAAGLQAIATGQAMICDGRVDAVLAGGADSRLTPSELSLFGRLCPLSSSSDPILACRPFDCARDGVAASEGAAMILLETEDSARARQVRAYAELVACASASAMGGGLAESMSRVMLASGKRSPDVVVAHGEGGVRSDRLEAAALGPISPRYVTSLQSAIGHTMSACGAMNVAAGCLILADGRVPPIRSLSSPEVPLPFATREVRAPFASVLTNASEPDSASVSALLLRA